MHKQQQWGALLFAAGICCTLLGCPKDQTPANNPTGTNTTANSAPGGAQKLRIAVIPKGTAHSFWLLVKAGADAAGAENNVDITWQGPDKETDFTQQINLVQTQVTSGVNGIVLAATNSESLVQPCKDAMAKGVKVVTIDSGLSDKDASLCYIATDNVKGGKLAADELAKEIGAKGDIGVLPFLKGAASSDQREKGFMDEIVKFPNIKVVSTLYTDSDARKANEQMINMMTANPQIVGVFAANEPGGVGAANALKSRKSTGKKIDVVAFDTSDDEVADLRNGDIQALIVQDPYQMGYLGVKTVLQAIKGQPIPSKYIDSGIQVVTKANLDTPAIQKLMHPAP